MPEETEEQARRRIANEAAQEIFAKMDADDKARREAATEAARTVLGRD